MALVAEQSETRDDGLLDVGALCRMFEEAEDSSSNARKESERDRDYVDGKQLTSAELAELAKRGQPPVIDNRIKTKVDYLVGLEKQQRVKPKAFPRTPKHEADADGATEALRYVAEAEDYEAKRSGVWRNMLVEGFAGIRVYAEPSKYGKPVDYMNSSMLQQQEMDICLQHIAWDRAFFDPHSAKNDFSDAGYLGIVTWMDYDDALAMYPDGKGVLDTTLAGAPSDTYDDKPKFSHWADKKRKRVRICQIWIKRDEQWYFAEYTKGGILKAGPSSYKTDKGESDCELIFQSAYVDRDNNRYGLVREMISLQDEINKRRSKSLDLLVRNQVTLEQGAVDDIEEYRKQRARTDGTMVVNPGALSNGNGPKIISEQKLELATAHFQLLQEAKNSIDLKGPNATEMGDKTQGSSSASGKAIIASQQGGMIQIGDLLDNLRHLDKRVFRTVWNRIRQFWTGEKWIRVTDDERNVKWLGLNLDPMQMQQFQMAAQQNPEAAQKIAGLVGAVAELDCDIIIDDAPDSLTPQLEQFQSLVELKKFDAQNEIPFRAIVAAMPNLKDKQSFLKALDEQAQQRQGQPDPETAKAMAQIEAKKQEAAAGMQIEREKATQSAQIEKYKADLNATSQERQALIDASIARKKAADEMQLKRDMAAFDAEIEAGKHAATIQRDREKDANSAGIERERFNRENEREDIRVQIDIDRDNKKDAGNTAKQSHVKANEALAKMLNTMTEAMKKQSKSNEMIAEALKKDSQPRQLVRDKSGNIIGSKPVETLKAE